MTSPATWKAEQREILRAAFAPAFVSYAQLVAKVNEPDDWRKYLEFIARQCGLEEPTAKSGVHDGLATVNINIGGFSRSAAPMTMVAPAPAVMLTPEDVAALPVDDEPGPIVSPRLGEEMPHIDPAVAKMLAADVIDAEPPRLSDFESALDGLLNP